MNRRQLLLGAAAGLVLIHGRKVKAADVPQTIQPRRDLGTYKTVRGNYVLAVQSELIPNTNVLSFLYIGISPLFPPRFRRPMKQILIDSQVLDPNDPEAIHNGPDIRLAYQSEDEFLLRVALKDLNGDNRITGEFCLGVNGSPVIGAQACLNLSGVPPKGTVSIMTLPGTTALYKVVPGQSPI